MERNLKRLKGLLAKAERISILCHQNADPDAIGAAVALRYALGRKGLEVALVAPEGLSLPSEKILESAGGDYGFEKQISASDAFILVDTSTVQQLGSSTKDQLLRSRTPTIIIDHHAPHPETLKLAHTAFIDDQSRSACEVVYGLLKRLKLKIDAKVAFILLCGIVFETKHLTIATSDTIRTVLELMQEGADLQRAVSILRIPMSESERIARLKAVRRMEATRIGPWTVAITEVGSYQASVARGIIGLGADLAIVGGEKKKEIRISLRCNQEIVDATKIHLGRDVAMPVGEAFKGMGGGHAQAAGINAYGNVVEALKMSKEIVMKLLDVHLSQH